MSCLGYTVIFLIHIYICSSVALSPPLALLSCSGHLCKGKQRTEGWTESGSGGGRKEIEEGKMVRRKGGPVEKERGPF